MKKSMMLISLVICLSSTVIYSQQVKEFFIGAHSVHDSANYNGSHRVWRGSEMSDEGWTKLRELGITMPLFDIRPENVNANFPRDLIDAARQHGFKVAINDDYIINVGRAQRRLYQAEEYKDFAYRISKDPLLVGYQPNFDDDKFDLDPTYREIQPPFPTNVALFTPDTTPVGVVLSGWVHRRELNLGTVYFLSARLALKAGSNPAPTDTVLRFVFRVKNQTHNDSISEIVWGNQITTTPTERFIKYFRIDLTSDEAPGHPKTCDSCRYKLTMYDTRPSDLGGSSLMTRKGAHWEDPGPDELILEVVYQKKASVYLDRINISDELGYAFFIGDNHCLPEHQKAPGDLTTPLDRDFQSHINNFITADTSTLKFILLNETGIANGNMSTLSRIDSSIRNKSYQKTQTFSYYNYYFYDFADPDHMIINGVRQVTEGGRVISGMYVYPLIDRIPRVNLDPASYYDDRLYIGEYSQYGSLSKYYRLHALARKDYQLDWICPAQNHSWGFIDGSPINTKPSFEQTEPNAAELRLQCNLGLCYGAKGIMYYVYNSFPAINYNPADSSRIGAQGFLNLDTTRRINDWHLQNKWDSTIQTNNKLKIIGSLLQPLKWVEGFSFDLEQQNFNRDTISWIVSQRLGIRTDPTPHCFVEIGEFRNEGDTLYLFVVNKRVDTLGARHITIKFGLPMTGFWKVTNIIAKDIWIVYAMNNKEDNDKGGFTDYFAPGDAWLYKVEKITDMPEQLANLQCIQGNLTITRGAYIDINGISLTFSDNKYLYVNGGLNASNCTFRHCTRNDPMAWG